MAIVYTIAPNPHWVIIDNFSKLPDGAAIYTYSSLQPSTFMPAFQDPAGLIPYGQPIVGFGNGTMPPIYWQFDPNNPSNTYYIRVYDSADPTTQQFLWDFDGLSGNTGGGGGTITEAIDVQNLIVNNVFYRNIGNQSGSPSLPVTLTIAPSNNAGFVNDTSNTSVIANGPVGPDIIFAKSNTTSTDQLNFTDFSPLGTQPLIGDITPVRYLNYQCTGAGSGETYKYIQFSISHKVQNLSAQQVTIRLFARCNSGNTTLTLNWRQFYGSGGSPTPDLIIPATAPLTLTSNWQLFTFPSLTPNATPATLGSCGNDALFLQIGYPLSPSLTNIDLIKPAVYLGDMAPEEEYQTDDYINSIVNSPRTGWIQTALNSSLFGFINMNDGTIGDSSSNATSRANKDTFPLFSFIWNTFSSSQTLAPMFNSGGSPVSYGASATADFTAHNQLSLVRNLGRVMAGALPTAVSQSFTNTGNVLTVTATASFNTGVPVVVSGGSLPAPLVAGVTYYAIMLSSTTMSLATTTENAILGTAIVLTTNALGTVTVPAHVLGSFFGEETYSLNGGNLAPHTHTIPGVVQNYCAAGGSSTYNTTGVSTTTTSTTGNGNPFNIIQPTVFMNVFVKL